MKTTVKQLAAGIFIAFLLMVGNVKASETRTKASRHENIETPLQLEKWMTDETIWNTNSANIVEFMQETEAELELENWMINDIKWTMSNIENEPELSVEPWMLNESYWK